MKNYQWQGKPVKVRFGGCLVKQIKDKPLWWWNYECDNPKGSAYIPTLEIETQDGEVFLISNHYGIGVHKLENGGWPNYVHFSVEGKFEETDTLTWDKFKLHFYEEHEAGRARWQKENYPEEYQKKRALLDSIVKKDGKYYLNNK